ncbi:MAG: YggT family protein [Desulfatiglandales bacterium]
MFVISNLLIAIAKIIDIALSLYMWVVIIRAIISWVSPDPYNPIVRILSSLTDPIFYAIRRRLPLTFGAFDLSPIIVILLIIFLQNFLPTTLIQLASKMG